MSTLQLLTDNLVHQVARLGYLEADQPVEDGVAFFPGVDDTYLAEYGEMLRSVGLLESQYLGQLADGLFPAAEFLYYPQSFGVG